MRSCPQSKTSEPLPATAGRVLVDAVKTERAERRAHQGMTKVRLQVLIWAGARDDHNPILAAQTHRLGRDTGHARGQTWFCTHQAVHPDAIDPEINTLLDDFLADRRVSQDENGVRLIRDRLQIGIAGIALESGQMWIDRIDTIPRLLEFVVGQVAAGLALVANTHHRDLFLGQEVLDEGINLGHKNSFRTVTVCGYILTDEKQFPPP